MGDLYKKKSCSTYLFNTFNTFTTGRLCRKWISVQPVLALSHFFSVLIKNICLTQVYRYFTPGRILELLVNKYLVHPVLALAKRANLEACKRVETLLQVQ